MRLTHAPRGEHGAINPILDLIERRLPADPARDLEWQVEILRSVLLTHAAIEDDVLGPAILEYLPPVAPLNVRFRRGSLC